MSTRTLISAAEFDRLGENDTLEAPELLPGFSAKVGTFF